MPELDGAFGEALSLYRGQLLEEMSNALMQVRGLWPLSRNRDTGAGLNRHRDTAAGLLRYTVTGLGLNRYRDTGVWLSYGSWYQI